MHFTSALSSIVVERLFDMVTVVVLLAALLLGLSLPPVFKAGGAAMGAVALAGIVILAIAARYPDGALRLAGRVMSIVPGLTAERVVAWLSPFASGLAAVTDLRVFGVGMGLSLIAWLSSSVTGWVLMLAFWPRMPLIMGVLATTAAGLGISVPSAPSAVGPFEAAIYAALTAVGLDANVTTSYAFVMHGVGFVMTCLVGALGLIREGVSFSEVAHAAQSLREQQIEDVSPEPGTSLT
jgi:uncharacterized protein (TIRG00374 family)